MGRMRRRIRWPAAAVGLAVALSLLSTAVASAAERKGGVQSPVQPYAFTLASSNGLSIYGFSSKLSRGRGRTRFSLMAERGREVAEYAVPAKLTKKGIWADFGKIGRVALRIHPTGKIEEARLPCIGESFPVSEGYYVGKIRFDGTEGFTAVRANRATGDIQPALGMICRDTIGNGPVHPGRSCSSKGGTSRAQRLPLTWLIPGSMIRFTSMLESLKDKAGSASIGVLVRRQGSTRLPSSRRPRPPQSHRLNPSLALVPSSKKRPESPAGGTAISMSISLDGPTCL